MTVSASMTTYYATASYQVNYRALNPGDSLSLPIAKGHGIWMPVTPGASLENEPLRPGTRIEWASDAPLPHVYNDGTGPVEILELVWTTIPAAEQRPLAEVTEERPWGSFTVLSDAPHFKLKQLWVKPGNRLSLQRHQKREEHWFVTAGHPEITLNDDLLHPSVEDYIYIPCQAWHRLANAAENTDGVEIIELQLGSYFGEDDIERQSDDYGRQ